jgi:lipoprotein-anchoring transpeptidase ErfK/SrfK
MRMIALSCAGGAAILLLASLAPPPVEGSGRKIRTGGAGESVDTRAPPAQLAATPVQAPPAPEPPPPPPPPTAAEALRSGVLVVVSLPSQMMYVFKDGEPWRSSKVSTGRRGKETPVGTFPILQKKVFHRSNLYDDAPMPYMQRLTWGGVALHAGWVANYPASHGCIRLPKAFAKALYAITDHSTVVVVTDTPLTGPEQAREVA